MAGLADRIGLIPKTGSGKPCGVSLIIDSLSGEDKESVITLMDRDAIGEISNNTIHKFFLNEGYDVKFSSVRVHRQKNCRCFKTEPRQVNIHD